MKPDFDFIYQTTGKATLITGTGGSGKTVTGHYIAEGYHKENPEYKFNLLVPLRIGARLRKQGALPDWMKYKNYQWTEYFLRQPKTFNILDDAALRAHAREWYRKEQINLNKMLTLRRHNQSMFLITTQETAEIDRGVMPKIDYWLLKKPGRMASKFERPEIRKDTERIRKNFIKLERKEKVDPRKYTWVESDLYDGFVGPTGLPTGWKKELGDW